MASSEGQIVQVIGPVVDIDFEDGHLPKIFNAIKIPRTSLEGTEEELVVEVQQHLGENRVRTIAMDTTDGLVRGMSAINTGEPISIPVGKGTLGRLISNRRRHSSKQRTNLRTCLCKSEYIIYK